MVRYLGAPLSVNSFCLFFLVVTTDDTVGHSRLTFASCQIKLNMIVLIVFHFIMTANYYAERRQILGRSRKEVKEV